MTRRWSEAQRHDERSDCSPAAGLEGLIIVDTENRPRIRSSARRRFGLSSSGPNVSGWTGPTTTGLSGLAIGGP